MAKKMLVTGGAGFIGSNYVHYVVEHHPDYEVTVVDALTYAGNKDNLASIMDKITFVEENICNEAAMDKLVEGQDYLVHFAAESHVDRSIDDPGPFLQTNIMGTEILARMAMKHGVLRMHHISTDEVFGSLQLDDGKTFNEETPYNPHSPYSAAKASSDHIVRAYGDTFGLNYTISNCSNNYGPYQFPEKLIPLFVMNAMEDKKLPVYGDGKAVRDYLHVVDHCIAIDKILHEAKGNETYCVGGGAERNTLEIAAVILKALGKPNDLIEFVDDRAGHDRRYAIDHTKIKDDLGWEPSVTFEEGMKQTIEWYQNNQEWLNSIKEKHGS